MELTSVLWTKDVCVALLVLIAAPLLYNLWLAFVLVFWRPWNIRRAFKSQGITCLPFRFIHGNSPEIVAMRQESRRLPMPDISHDIASRLLPHICHFREKYGDQYVYWLGSQARIDIYNVEDVKEILSTNEFYTKPDLRPDCRGLLGYGLATIEGEKWSQHRRIMNPAFFLEKLKAMIPTKVACTTAVIDKWATSIEKGQAIDVYKEFKDLTADIIAHTAFGSSFAEGKQVFELQAQQEIFMFILLNSVYIPGTRFLPTTFNRLCWRVDSNIKRALRQVINNRLKAVELGQGHSYGNDLLGLIMTANQGDLEGHQKKWTMSTNDIIDECKTFFYAGHDTTAALLTWTALLLAINPGWQERTREEVHAICGKDAPTADSLSHLKIMGMVLNEALRLYPPLVSTYRTAAKDMELGKIRIPKGTEVVLPILAWNHDERYWGIDANEFRPERFSEGISKAGTVAGAFMPFLIGPHVCIGQNFALFEAKVVLSMILQRYRFRLSPAYQHSPTSVITLQPQWGMPILFEKL